MKIYLSSHGVKASNRDNAPAINKAIAGAKPYDRIIFPNGDLIVKSTIKVEVPVRLEGAENTKLSIDHSDIAIHVCAVGDITRIKDLWIKDQVNHAFLINSRVYMDDVTIEGLYGHCFGDGILVRASVNGGTNANFCHFVRVRMQYVHNAFHFIGPDANHCHADHVEWNDITGIGWLDNSFLGCYAIVPMGHYSKGGDYRINQDSSMGGLVGHYSENAGTDADGEPNQPADFIGGYSGVIMGRSSNGLEFGREGYAFYAGKFYEKGVEFDPFLLMMEVEKLKKTIRTLNEKS